MSEPSPRYAHTPRVVGRRIHGTMVLVRLETLEACELNALGARVWELATSSTEESIAARVASAVERTPAEVGPDVARFLRELVAEGWLVTRAA